MKRDLGIRNIFWAKGLLLLGLFLWFGSNLNATNGEAPHAEEETGQEHKDHKKHSSRLDDHAVPMRPENVPSRPKPIIEWGEPFLGTGTLKPGFRLPTGAVWQPGFIVFGTWRTGIQASEFNDVGHTEVATRLDLFGNLQLSGTERLVIGFRNFDRNGNFTNYVFDSDILPDSRGNSELNTDLQSLFFEGDFGEIFPNLSRDDFRSTDIGFSIGRQPLFFQEGLLINDTVDGIGITRNTLLPKNTSNFRITAFLGLNNLNRNAIARDNGKMLAILTSTDFRRSTMDIDAVYVRGENGEEDLYAFGISAVQRMGFTNTSFRLLGSFGNFGPQSGQGFLAFGETSWTPHHSHNLVYFNGFVAIDEYTAVAQAPSVGGPLGRAGISFASPGLGFFGAPLSSRAAQVAGGALGYQKFLAHTRQQLIMELGFRIGLGDAKTFLGNANQGTVVEVPVDNQIAGTVRYQMALGQRFVLAIDSFISHEENSLDIPGFEEISFGGRFELTIAF